MLFRQFMFFLACMVFSCLLLADAPVEEVYSINGGNTTRSEALVYHYEQVLRGENPDTGSFVTVWLPEWSHLTINNSLYTFTITQRNYEGEPDPFVPTWKVTLKNVAFSQPIAVKKGSCSGLADPVILHYQPEKAPDCSLTPEKRAELESKYKGCGDCNPCYDAYKLNYESCEQYFPKLQDSSNYKFLSDIPGESFVVADISAGVKVIKDCEKGIVTACEKLSSHYYNLHPDNQQRTGCEYLVKGEWSGYTRSVNELECEFNAYHEAIKQQCTPPQCQARYIWLGQTEVDLGFTEYPEEKWKPVRFPPPLSSDKRLIKSSLNQ